MDQGAQGCLWHLNLLNYFCNKRQKVLPGSRGAGEDDLSPWLTGPPSEALGSDQGCLGWVVLGWGPRQRPLGGMRKGVSNTHLSLLLGPTNGPVVTFAFPCLLGLFDPEWPLLACLSSVDGLKKTHVVMFECIIIYFHSKRDWDCSSRFFLCNFLGKI